MTDDEDDFTEVRKANIPRLDLVDHAANGTPFLIMKSESPNLLSTDFVQELITKAEEPNMTVPKPGSWLAKADEPTIDEPLVEPNGADAVAASVPASPEWEQVDADSAANAYAVLARVNNTLGVLAEREAIEATTEDGDEGDAENAWCLDDAQSAVDYAMDTVAVYAASEALEAEPMEKAAAIVKAVSGLTEALSTVESYGSLRKAGRTLSAANESKLRSASEQITSVLASLPAAPDEVTKEAATVVTEVPASEVVEKSTEPEGVEDIEKADEESTGLQAVFDASGNLVGVVDPTAIQAVSGASSDASDDEPAEEPAPDPDVAPEPAEVGAPGDEVAKSLNVEDLVKSAVDEVRAEQAELIKGLRDDIDFLKAPAAPRAFANGADGSSIVTRDGEVLKGAGDAEALIKASQDAPDSATRTKFNNQRGQMARELLIDSRPVL